MEDFKKPGHTYFALNNTQLFGSVKGWTSIAAADFPMSGKGKTFHDAVTEIMEKEGSVDGLLKDVTDTLAISLTVKSEVPGFSGGITGGTIILNEEEQDKLILAILERRGRLKSAPILQRIQDELPDEGIVANSGVKSKFSPADDEKLPGEQAKDDRKDNDDCDCPACRLRRAFGGIKKGGINMTVLEINGKKRSGGFPEGLAEILEEAFSQMGKK